MIPSIFDTKNISPMLLNETQPFDSKDYIYELKLDGIRCLAYLDKTSTNLRNKRDKDVTDTYPELSSIHKCAKKRCIIDGELILLENGKPNFYELQRRSLMTDKFRIELMSRRNPVLFVAYDIIFIEDKEIMELDLLSRKSILQNNIVENLRLSISRYIEEKGVEFFNLAKMQDLEGIVAKKKGSIYQLGKRSKEWLKIKAMQDEDLIVCGYEVGDDGGVKDVILADYDINYKLQYRGKVYLGVSKSDQMTILEFAKSNMVRSHFELRTTKELVWLTPYLVGAVHYMQKTKNGQMRQPVFKGLRDDKAAIDCKVDY